MRFIFTEKDFYVEETYNKNDKKAGTAADKETSAERKVTEAFHKDKYQAWYQLGLEERPQKADAGLIFLYTFSDLFFKMLTDQPELELTRGQTAVEPSEECLEKLENAVPFVIGAEYVDRKWLERGFETLRGIFEKEMSDWQGTVAMYLTEKNQQLRVPERIFFHLVENKEEDYPFAFLATYATKREDGRVVHVPLQYALTEYRGQREKLLALLSCLNRSAEVSDLIRQFVESGEMFHPLRLTAEEAYAFLKNIPQIEETGILCRIPNWWKKKAAAVSLSVTMGEEKPAMLGFDTILSLQPRFMVDGVALTKEDIRELLGQTEGLAFLKGKWIEVDHARLEKLLKEMEQERGELTLLEALRKDTIPDDGASDDGKILDVGALVTNGKWLSDLLLHLRKPELIRKPKTPAAFKADLRPYQKNGYAWLDYMAKLGFGACLADDMGLGKTVQVLAFLEKMRTSAGKRKQVLLIVPASLLGNWQKETEKFAPEMDIRILHGRTAPVLETSLKEESSFLTVTTYGMASRMKALQDMEWDCVILDEAQAIKNPATKQTKEIKKIPSKMRLAMTGTPIENDLTNLWSLFDFLDKGLLGTSKEFQEYCKKLEERPEEYARLKAMISPFMLRRVKTDKRVISDLPEKLESIDYTGLAKKQVVLYRGLVAELAEKIETLDGMERRGLILAALTHLKQICNHPDQYLGQQSYLPEESGKFGMLRELCETIYEKRERVLIFTQFKEMTEPLSAYLEEVFHKKGFVLHGGTPVKRRSEIVDAFNGEDYVPYIVLSVKAGGTGLNLVKANHVIHFDRWWNPAVENQATDRAYRIGQKKNVMVHKFVCEGTIEERIDAMISSKKELAENVIGSGGESWLTEMSNQELLSMLTLGQPDKVGSKSNKSAVKKAARKRREE